MYKIKKIWVGVIIPLLFVNCIVPGGISEVNAQIFFKPIMLESKVHGCIAFAGYQIQDFNFLKDKWKNYPSSSKFSKISSLSKNFIRDLGVTNRGRIEGLEYETSEKISFYESTQHGGRRQNVQTNTIFVTEKSIPIFDYTWDYSSNIIWPVCRDYLLEKSDANYFLSVTGCGIYVPRSTITFQPRLIISLYDRSGTKVFCRIYQRDYADSFRSSDIDEMYFYYLDKLASDCIQVINTDISTILKDADPPKGKTLEDRYLEYNQEVKK